MIHLTGTVTVLPRVLNKRGSLRWVLQRPGI